MNRAARRCKLLLSGLARHGIECSLSTSALCFDQSNGTASVSVSGGTGPFQFIWNNDQTAANISGLSAGAYSVTATDANGCTTVGSVSVAQPAALSVNFLNSSQPTCEASINGSIAVQVNGGTQPYDFQWDSGQQTANISGLGVGDYRLTVTDINGCQASFQASLTAAGSLDVLVSATDPSCAGLNNGSATVTTPGAFSYQWSVPGTGQQHKRSIAGNLLCYGEFGRWLCGCAQF